MHYSGPRRMLMALGALSAPAPIPRQRVATPAKLPQPNRNPRPTQLDLDKIDQAARKRARKVAKIAARGGL